MKKITNKVINDWEWCVQNGNKILIFDNTHSRIATLEVEDSSFPLGDAEQEAVRIIERLTDPTTIVLHQAEMIDPVDIYISK